MSNRTAHRPQTRQQIRHRRRRRPSAFALSIALIAALGVLAVVMTRPQRPSRTALDGKVTVTGDALPEFTGEGRDPAVGTAAPAAAGENFDGVAVSVPSPGRPTAILFVAHWCPHCQREVPNVVGWVEAGAVPDGVDLVAVSTSNDPAKPNYPPDTWLEREGWTSPVMLDARRGTVATAYGLRNFPYWVFVDAEGKVAGRHAGALPENAFEAMMRRLTG